MAIKVLGTNKVISALSKGIEKYVKRTEKATMKAGLKAEYFAKKNTPVDTGNLRSSINTQLVEKKKDRVEAVVGTNIEYAPFVEFGTRKMKPRSMFRKVVDENGKEVWKTFNQALSK